MVEGAVCISALPSQSFSINSTVAIVSTYTFEFLHTFKPTSGGLWLLWKFSKPPKNIPVQTLSLSGRTRLCVLLPVGAGEMFLW